MSENKGLIGDMAGQYSAEPHEFGLERSYESYPKLPNLSSQAGLCNFAEKLCRPRPLCPFDQ